MKFITVHSSVPVGYPITINVDLIKSFTKNEYGDAIIEMCDGTICITLETYYEVRAMLMRLSGRLKNG